MKTILDSEVHNFTPRTLTIINSYNILENIILSRRVDK